MDRNKIATILDWHTPTTVKDVQRFLGFANFYRRFVKSYFTITAPLTRLTRKDHPFLWTTDAQQAFNKLKASFTAPTLAHPESTRPYLVKTDASDFALEAILSQPDSADTLHPVAFYLRKFTAAEINYKFYDKELLAIIIAFEYWRPYFLGA